MEKLTIYGLQINIIKKSTFPKFFSRFSTMATEI